MKPNGFVAAAPITSHTEMPRRRHMIANSFTRDRKSTRLNSSHSQISYAVFCLKKKKKKTRNHTRFLISKTATLAHYASHDRDAYTCITSFHTGDYIDLSRASHTVVSDVVMYCY